MLYSTGFAILTALAGLDGMTRAIRFESFGGPEVLEYGDVELEYRDPTDGRVSMDDDGVGLGWYARGGIEFALDPYTWIGLGARWVDSELALGGGFDDYELDALQLVLTMSTGL